MLAQKLRNLLGGRGGGQQKITLDYRGVRGRSRESKKGLHNFLTVPKCNLTILLASPEMLWLATIWLLRPYPVESSAKNKDGLLMQTN